MVVPSAIDSKRRLLELLEGVEGFDSAQRSSSENSTTDIFETVASLLSELSTAPENDNTPTIQLLAEQVKLMSTKKERRRYSVEFLKVQNQRQVATELTLQLLGDEEPSDLDVCEKGHASAVVLKYILWCSTNILLKNFCRRLSNKASDPDSKTQKRKLQTITNK